MRSVQGAVLATFLLAGLGTAVAEEIPPEGPPWRFDWRVAKREAVRSGRPIFAYFTKKH